MRNPFGGSQTVPCSMLNFPQRNRIDIERNILVLKAILWDFDGTICDTYPAIAHAVNQALARFGATASFERVVELTSISLDTCIRTLAREYGIRYDDLDAAFSHTYKDIQLIDQAPFPGFTDLCKKLTHLGIKHFIVTHRRRHSLLALLDLHKLRSYFTDIVAADDGFAKSLLRMRYCTYLIPMEFVQWKLYSLVIETWTYSLAKQQVYRRAYSAHRFQIYNPCICLQTTTH